MIPDPLLTPILLEDILKVFQPKLVAQCFFKNAVVIILPANKASQRLENISFGFVFNLFTERSRIDQVQGLKVSMDLQAGNS